MNFWKGSTIGLLLALGVVLGGSAIADRKGPQAQPQMEAALTSLREAKKHLSEATADKGGHRVKALELTSAAIEQVEKGIAYDNMHK
jgi:hypothetical protein